MAAKSRSEFQANSRIAVVFAQLLVIAVITLVLVWLLHFREGVGFNSPNKLKLFNLHPLLMVIGFVLISGEGIMMYKIIPAPKEKQKLIHLIWHFIALVAGIVGIYAMFKYHHDVSVTDMYSLHSWIGISTISLFAIQWILGFFSFMWPVAEQKTKAKLVPWHALLGIVIFFMAILTAEIGLDQMFIYLSVIVGSQEALIINFTGLLLLLYAISVGLVVLLPRKTG